MSQDKTGPDDKQPPEAAAPASTDPAAEAMPPEPDQPVSAEAKRIAELEADCSQLRAKLDEVLRAYAEGENRRKRLERDAVEQRKYAAGPLAADVAAVAETLRRALATIDDEVAEQDPTLKSFHEGVEMTERELLKSLQRHGVIRIDPNGEKFDPNQHEAMANIPSDTVASGFVAEVFQAGYVLHERVLQPAKVVVSQGTPDAAVADVSSPPAPGDEVAKHADLGPPANNTEPRTPGWQRPPQPARSDRDNGDGQDDA